MRLFWQISPGKTPIRNSSIPIVSTDFCLGTIKTVWHYTRTISTYTLSWLSHTCLNTVGQKQCLTAWWSRTIKNPHVTKTSKAHFDKLPGKKPILKWICSNEDQKNLILPFCLAGKNQRVSPAYCWSPECSRQQYTERNTVTWWSRPFKVSEDCHSRIHLHPFPWHLFTYSTIQFFFFHNTVTLFTGKYYFFFKYLHIHLKRKQNHILSQTEKSRYESNRSKPKGHNRLFFCLSSEYVSLFMAVGC